MLLSLFLIFFGRKNGQKLRLWFNYKKTKRSDTKLEKNTNKLRDTLGCELKTPYKPITGKMKQEKFEKLEGRRNQNRLDILEEGIEIPEGTEGIEMEESISKESPPPQPNGLKRKRKITRKSLSLSLGALLLIIILIFLSFYIGKASACENVLSITSLGEICDTNKNQCQKSHMTSFYLQIGKIVCFEDVHGNKVNLTLKSMHNIVTYKHIYDTTDFEIVVGTPSDLCGLTGDFCNNKTCTLNSKHPEFKDRTHIAIQGYTCQTTPSCQTWCFFSDFSCTYLHWWLEPIGNIVKVYKYTYEIWGVSLEIKYGEHTKNIPLDLNKPTFGLDGDGLTNFKTIPITIDGSMRATYRYANNLIEDTTGIYEVEANELNFPQSDKIGDYQIQIEDGKSAMYNINNVRCQADFCGGRCIAPEPALRRFRNTTKPKYNEREYIIVNDMDITIKAKHDVYVGGVKIVIGNVDIKNLEINNALCDVGPLFNYACIGCNRNPYVVFQAHNIEAEGALYFTSNCTFDNNYVSCSNEPFKLSLLQHHTYCRLFFDSINKTIHIEMDIENIGILLPYKPIYDDKFGIIKAAHNILINDTFKNVFTFTVIREPP